MIRRLVADGVPQRQVARDLGIGRSTVERALASDRPPKYERAAVPTSFEPFVPLVRMLFVMAILGFILMVQMGRVGMRPMTDSAQ